MYIDGLKERVKTNINGHDTTPKPDKWVGP